MFAAASGARLAHRHNKTVKKQISSSQLEGVQVHYKGYQRQQQLRHSDIHGNRFSGISQSRPNYSSKLYSSNCDSGLKLSTSYIDINGRISKLGHVDFEGKAAWQDREHFSELERRESICVPSEAALTHRTKQREAHRRWVKRNRIHDLSFGDCSSEEEEFLYGVQNGAANLLLYIGLGTMCVGMIIAFVGTGEKGFKTMELRLIGPSLIGAGVLIIIFRILLCVCPSKCLKTKKSKHKLKNSTNKLNSEGNQTSQELFTSRNAINDEPNTEKSSINKGDDGKKRVSIAMLPTTSGLSTNFPTSSSDNFKSPNSQTYQKNIVPTISFFECEKPTSSKASLPKVPNLITSDEEDEKDEKIDFELNQLSGSNFDVTSFGSHSSYTRKLPNLSETFISADNSDISITSLGNEFPDLELGEKREENKPKASKFEVSRNPKNVIPSELVLSPSNLNEKNEVD